MSVTILITLEVADFDTWLVGYTEASAARSAAGISSTAYRNIDNPHAAQVIGLAPSKEAFIAFFSSPEMQERLKKGGVTAPPVTTFLEEA